jgi:hypothetical protein
MRSARRIARPWRRCSSAARPCPSRRRWETPWPARRSPCASSMTGSGRPTKGYPVELGRKLGVLPPPCGGGVGRGDAFGNSSASIARPPPPTPPQRGGGEPTERAATFCVNPNGMRFSAPNPKLKAASSAIARLHAGPYRASLWRRQSTTCSIRCSLVARIARCRPVVLISTTRFAGRNLLISSRSAFPLRSFSSSSHRPLAFASTSATP